MDELKGKLKPIKKERFASRMIIAMSDTKDAVWTDTAHRGLAEKLQSTSIEKTFR